MRTYTIHFLTLSISCVALVSAKGRFYGRPGIKKVELSHHGLPLDHQGNGLPPLDTTYYFDQLIDHDDPSLGTFQQRYWHTWEFYEPGKGASIRHLASLPHALL